MSRDIRQYPYQIKKCSLTKHLLKCHDMEHLADVIRKNCSTAAIVAEWLPDKLLWGRYDGKSFSMFDDKRLSENMLEMRIFNENTEIYVRRSGKGFRVRILQENNGTGSETEYVDSQARLWGDSCIHAYLANCEPPERAPSWMMPDIPPDGYVHLEDVQRGIEMTIPVPAGRPSSFYSLVTRSYIGYLANSQATYTDTRYVAIIGEEEE